MNRTLACTVLAVISICLHTGGCGGSEKADHAEKSEVPTPLVSGNVKTPPEPKSVRVGLAEGPVKNVRVVTARAWAASPAAPTFQELMDPKLFPDPQRGMVVESAQVDGDSIRVRTTGADIRISLSTGQIVFGQRIGHQRPLAVARTEVSASVPVLPPTSVSARDSGHLAKAFLPVPSLTVWASICLRVPAVRGDSVSFRRLGCRRRPG